MPTRLKDIAEALDVSIVTVSKVVRGKRDVAPRTRELILRTMEQMGYRPNLLARGLAQGRSYSVGLIVPDIADPFFAELARSLGAALRREHYQLLLASADETPAVEQKEIEHLLQRGVDALLLASCHRDATAVQAAFDAAAPCVLLDRLLPGTNAHFVGTDDVLAGRIATNHLLSLGRRRIAHLAGQGTSNAEDRLAGYRAALQEAGRSVAEERVVLCDLRSGRADLLGREAMRRLLERPDPPDAVFCYSDLIAVGAVHAVREMGWRVPGDVAVIGCGNLSLSAYLEVPLSTVDQRTSELGQRAAQTALALIEGRRDGADGSAAGGKAMGDSVAETRVAPELVVRASTGA